MHPQFTSPRILERIASRLNRNGPIPPPWEGCPEPGPCHVWTKKTDHDGYGIYDIRVDRKIYSARVHRVLWIVAHGDISSEIFVCHHCDNPPCGNIAHLFPGTNLDNRLDSVSKGRHAKGPTSMVWRHPELVPRGIKQPHAKLNDAMVHSIRERAANGAAGRQLAKDFAVSPATICLVIARKAWAHVR